MGKDNTIEILKDVNYNELVENIRVLIPFVHLGINYSFDEKFVLWAIKNDFGEYLKYN